MVAYKNSSRKRPVELYEKNGRLRELTWLTMNISFLFHYLVQCRDNGDHCMYTELYTAVQLLFCLACINTEQTLQDNLLICRKKKLDVFGWENTAATNLLATRKVVLD